MLLVAAALGVAGWSSSFTVAENEHAIVMRFGDPRRTIDDAGLHFKWPAPIDTVMLVDGRMHVLDPEPDEYLTRNDVNVIVDHFLVWSVADPLQFYRSVNDRTGAEARLADVLRSVVGDVLSRYPFTTLINDEQAQDDEDVASMQDVNEAMTAEAAERAGESFGIHITAVRIKRLNFPMQNKNAVFRRMEEERAVSAQRYRSEGTAQYEEIKADVDRQEAEILATANEKARKIRGAADAEAARTYSDAIARDPELYEYLRSLEVLEESLGEDDQLVIPSDHDLLRVLQRPAPGEKTTEGQ